MLSRVAESLMWMSRYIERADSLARIVESINQLTLDYRHPSLTSEAAFWEPVFDVFDLDKGDFIQKDNEEAIEYHFLLDRQNMSSVFACVAAARFNARGIRDQLPNEVWEILNDLYIYCKQEADHQIEHLKIAEFSGKVRFSTHCLRGLIEASMKRGEAWAFLMLGMKLERADQVSRMIDLKTFMISPDRNQVQLLEPYAWLIIMQSSGGVLQKGFGSANSNWPRMIELLIFDLKMPNSIRSCVKSINQILHMLSVTDTETFTNQAEQTCGRLKANLAYKAFDEKIQQDLHNFLDEKQASLAELFTNVLAEYTYVEPKSSTETPIMQSQS